MTSAILRYRCSSLGYPPQHHVRVDTAQSERTHPGVCPLTRPRGTLDRDFDGHALPRYMEARLRAMQASRDYAGVQRECSLDDPRNAGRSFRMIDVGLYRSNGE